jgi:hypothetical protein
MIVAQHERGAALPFVAAAMLTLVLAAAWAVDVSSFYSGLRSDQTVADLSCLAGAAELPGTSSTAITEAAALARLNWPAMTSATLTTSGDTGVMADGNGNRMTFTARWGGDPAMFRVEVTERRSTSFGQAAGIENVDLRQVATCSGGDYPDRGATVPFGALVGGFNGGLFAPNPCGSGSGNCGSLFVTGDSNGDFINDSGSGVQAIVTPNPVSSPVQQCSTAAAGVECDQVSSNTGVSASIMGSAMLARLDDPVHSCTSWVRSGNNFNCDSLSQVLGGAPTTLMSEFPSTPSWWDTSLYGAYNAANTTNHYWWDAPVGRCDSPRWVSIPIVAEDLAWKLGDPPGSWPSGKKPMKVVGMFDAILLDPNSNDDFNGSANLKTITSAVIWLGPDATCWDGRLTVGVLNGADGHDQRLVRLEPD